jgi:hypothetical protein
MGIAPLDASAHPDGARTLLAFMLDRAVWSFGTAVETDMDEAEARLKKGKSQPKPAVINRARQKVLDSYLEIGKAREVTQTGRYRDPALSVNRRKR